MASRSPAYQRHCTTLRRASLDLGKYGRNEGQPHFSNSLPFYHKDRRIQYQSFLHNVSWNMWSETKIGTPWQSLVEPMTNTKTG